jgi:DnaJ-class molecular chaperone
MLLEGKGNEEIGKRRGDIILHLEEEKNGKIRREGAELWDKIEINLRTALEGGYYFYKHLNGLTYKIKIDGILTEDSKLKIPGLGMPVYRSDKKGDLNFELKIKFPENIKEGKNLREIIGGDDPTYDGLYTEVTAKKI